MTAWQLPLLQLPEGEQHELWISGDRFTSDPLDGAERLPGRFALPGLVDAHAHLALGTGSSALHGVGPFRADDVVANLRLARDEGVLLVRDVGAPGSVTLDITPTPELPRLQAAGRWHAPEGRFFPPFHDPVPESRLVEAALHEVARGARWVKIIADWTTAELSYDPEAIRAVIEAVHAAGARVATHTQWHGVGELVALGVDSVEHGCRLDVATLQDMAARGTAWAPTLTAFNQPLPEDATAERRERVSAVLDNYRAMLPVAARLGVPILTGTDTAGSVTDEIATLISFGLSPVEALRAATTTARSFLGAAGLEDGAPADVITFDADPRDDPEILRRPAAIVLAGVRVS